MFHLAVLFFEALDGVLRITGILFPLVFGCRNDIISLNSAIGEHSLALNIVVGIAVCPFLMYFSVSKQSWTLFKAEASMTLRLYLFPKF